MTLNLQEDYNTGTYVNPHAKYQLQLELPITLDLSVEIPEYDLARTVIKAVEESGIIRYVDCSQRNRAGGFDGMSMLKAVCLSNALIGSSSLREMEDLCRNDIRFRLIFPDRTPSFMSFQRFINNDLKGSVEIVLTELNKYMAACLGTMIDTDSEVIDGTKEEADANKMTFVWRKASEKFYSRCYKKTYKLLTDIIKYFDENHVCHSLSILRKFDLKYLMEITLFLEEYAKESSILFVYGKGKKKSQIQRWYDELKGYAINLWKYEMHFDILADRNSFSTTDPDATFMHMKYDYYNHTNVFKPGYNVQIGSCSGFIWDIYISADCSDQKPYIPLMEQHFRNYGSYPKRTPADAGYGGFDNYKYCRDHGIELYMKYSGYEAKKEKITDKNRFHSNMFKNDSNGMPVCPAGHSFRLLKTRTETRGVYPREMETLVNDHCMDCPLKEKCTKSQSGTRKIQRCVQLQEWQKEVDENLETQFGKEQMKNRRVFSEGIFGDKKSNYQYDKMRRVGESGVKVEIYMYAIGKNMRRFHELLWEKKAQETETLKKLLTFVHDVIPS